MSALAARFEEWKEANLHGVVVVRHGKLAFEHYFRGFDLKACNGPGIIDFNAMTTHDLRSMTKSVTALVLGVAIDRDIIADVNQSVLSFFPDYADLRTPEKDRITIRHLLTMSMGLDWNDDAPYTNEDTLNRSLDPYRYVLSLPVVERAGSVWNYSGGATALIGGILSRATGKRFDVLAAALLFNPLGISDVTWTWLPNGDPKDWCCCGCGRATWRRSASSCSIVAVGMERTSCQRRGLRPPPHRRSRRSTAASTTVFNSGLAPRRSLVGGSIGWKRKAKADSGSSPFRPSTSSQW